jgi:hypothetical protein
VPVKSARREELRSYTDLGKRMQQELERFFVASSAFTSKDPVVRGWVGPDAANDMVQRSISRYRERSARQLAPSPRFDAAAAPPLPSDTPVGAESSEPVAIATAGLPSGVPSAIAATADTLPHELHPTAPTAVILSAAPAFLSEHPLPPPTPSILPVAAGPAHRTKES